MNTNSNALPPTAEIDDIVLSVTEITSAIKSHVEPIFRNISIRGEISNLKVQASGHIYFSLIDKNSLIQAVVFRSYVTKAIERLKEGDEIIARGEITIYPPRGNYQLVIRDIKQQGAGLELMRLEMLKKKLLELGWFRQERKKPIPSEWKRIGIITSPTGAVIRDILSVLERRMNGSFQLVLYPVRVQGETAPQEIATAIREMNRLRISDLIIVCRGGGSSDDLAAFNSEIVAHACFDSTLPIISAVGHETDTTIIDLVADVRAPTPSAAAEIASQRHADFCDKLQQYQKALFLRITHNLVTFQQRHVEKKKALFVAYAPLRLREFYEQKLDDKRLAFHGSIERIFHKENTRLENKRSLLQSLNPLAVLHNNQKKFREYAIRFHERISFQLALYYKELLPLQDHFHNAITRATRQKKAMYASSKIEDRLFHRIRSTLQSFHDRFEMAKRTHALLNPKLPLEKGYAVIIQEKQQEGSLEGKREQVVDSVHSLKNGDIVKIMLHDGTALAEIQRTHIL